MNLLLSLGGTGMRAILVDDEPLALDHLERLLRENRSVNIIGKYTNPHKALQIILQDQPDVVFLDINMPEISGIEMAKKVKTAIPSIKIVFTTAYNEYAVKAFEINAVDYIVKPIQRNRLAETINRLGKKYTTSQIKENSQMICCFQTLQFVSLQEEPKIIDVKWRTSKARELFTYLIQNRQKPVHRDVLVEIFWPEIDLDKGYAQLYATIYQIRKTVKSIGFHITITSVDRSYILHLHDVKLDVEEWEKGVREWVATPKRASLTNQTVLNLYKGDYLVEEGYLWAESERERLRTLWLTYIRELAEDLTNEKNIQRQFCFINGCKLLILI